MSPAYHGLCSISQHGCEHRLCWYHRSQSPMSNPSKIACIGIKYHWVRYYNLSVCTCEAEEAENTDLHSSLGIMNVSIVQIKYRLP